MKFARIDRFRRKIAKYRAIVSPPRLPRQPLRRGSKKRKTSRFIGVSWDAKGKWRAQVKEGKSQTFIGYYDDEEQAAREYNAYVRRHDLGSPLNDVDANGKPLPTTFKRTSRFWGVSWKASHSKWRAKYRDASTPSRSVDVGYFVDEERAALTYNKAVTDAGLAEIRNLNRVDASGRPLPKDED